MLRTVVCIVSSALVVLTFAACSDATPPTADRASGHPAISADLLPVATGVHVAVLTGLDQVNATALNDWGEVVGSIVTSGGGTQAFKWQATRGLRVLTTPSGVVTNAVGVNNAGQVAITITTDTSQSAAIWDWFGHVMPLRDLSTYRTASARPTCTASAINNAGIVAGTCTVLGQPSSIPTIWTKSGRPDALHWNGGSLIEHGYANAIADSGIVSIYDSIPVDGAIIGGTAWSLKAQREVTPPGAVSARTTVGNLVANDSGYAAGWVTGGCPQLAALFIAPFDGAQPPEIGICGAGVGISDDNVAVGWGYVNNHVGGPTFAWVWKPAYAFAPHALPGLEGGAAAARETSVATAINHRHQILGVITTSTGQRHTVIWTLP
jgi:hypothetical protein